MKDPRFRVLLLTLIVLIGTSAAGKQNANPALPSIVCLFSSFRGNGDGLHLAWSADGLKSTALAEDRSLLQLAVGGKLMRDPFILQEPDISAQLAFPPGTKQGTGFAVSGNILTALLAYRARTRWR